MDASPVLSAMPLPSLREEVKLSPKSQTQRTRVLAALSRVTSISISDVVKEDGHRYYVIDIRLTKTQQGLGKTGGSESSKASGPVDFQIKKRFHEFSNLRHEMYYHAHSGHRNHKRPCEFCASVLDFLTHATSLPRLHNLVLNSTETTRQQLEDFLNLALDLASRTKSHSAQWCEGQSMVPLLVKQFLLGEDGEFDASVPSTSAQARPTGWSYTTAWSA